MRRRAVYPALNGETDLADHMDVHAVASLTAETKQPRFESTELHVGHATCICAALALMVSFDANYRVRVTEV